MPSHVDCKFQFSEGRQPTSGRLRAVVRTRTMLRFPVPVGYRRRNRPEVGCLPIVCLSVVCLSVVKLAIALDFMTEYRKLLEEHGIMTDERFFP